MKKIRVLLADDHTLFREGVRLLLEGSGEVSVAGEASDGHEAVTMARQVRPDVVVMDLSMPGLNGMDATEQIRREFPNTRVLALTMHDSDDYFFRSLQAGASGYVLKDAAGIDLLAALRTVHRGGVFIYPAVAQELVKSFLARVAGGEDLVTYQALTAREREILQLIGEGLTNAQIGEQLHLTVNTVQSHRSHIMDKLNLHSRAELMRYAVRLGYRQT